MPDQSTELISAFHPSNLSPDEKSEYLRRLDSIEKQQARLRDEIPRFTPDVESQNKILPTNTSGYNEILHNINTDDLSDEINWSDVNADGEINDDDIIYANDMIYNLGTDQNLGNFGTDWYIYNENGEFPTNFGDVFPFQHGKGYILSLFQNINGVIS